MKQRDRAIIENLLRFRVMSRDDIVDIHFSNLKQPITNANSVLKRLRRDGLIEACTKNKPYLYFANPAPIKKDSQKIPHFLEIVKSYRQVRKYEEPKIFTVEPKYEKGYMEPDVFMIWKGSPFFVEIQRNVYSEKLMKEKIDRYEAYYFSEEWKNEEWQPKERKVFPYLIIISDSRYSIKSDVIRIFQTPNIKAFMKKIT